jgi:hypothetical protein
MDIKRQTKIIFTKDNGVEYVLPQHLVNLIIEIAENPSDFDRPLVGKVPMIRFLHTEYELTHKEARELFEAIDDRSQQLRSYQ